MPPDKEVHALSSWNLRIYYATWQKRIKVAHGINTANQSPLKIRISATIPDYRSRPSVVTDPLKWKKETKEREPGRW